MRESGERLRDILEAIARIERYGKRGRAEFDRDELIQTWCLRHLQIIGEAARLVPQEVRDRSAGVPWSKIVGMRHILVHHYFEIDTDVVWDAIDRDLPDLKTKIERLLDELEE